ncbi:sodium:proton antiporter [Kocuria coralli]|uniref:Sodium:proton antiporter n=1 Tax=Kocuria coralli TaxID=1461025 RepID=A0A5J5KUK2_9MICC|nr:Na+/H+ antiporter subunit E [Kocuria coralli]KAA9392890.1 sodium:proton antiporter [Kocuria coralli]
MTWLTWPLRLLLFVFWYAKELVVSSMAVIKDNMTPGQNSTPGLTRMPTRCRNDGELTLLAALITVTPGTLVIGNTTTDGTRVLFVHTLYFDNADASREELAIMETEMLKAVRREGAPA